MCQNKTVAACSSNCLKGAVSPPLKPEFSKIWGPDSFWLPAARQACHPRQSLPGSVERVSRSLGTNGLCPICRDRPEGLSPVYPPVP